MMCLPAPASVPAIRDLEKSPLAWICQRGAPRPALAEAIPDRFVHNACQLNLKGDSMRKHADR